MQKSRYNIENQEQSEWLPVVLSAIGEESVRGVQRPVDILLLQEIGLVNRDAKLIADLLNGNHATDVYDHGVVDGQINGSDRQGVVYRSDVLSLLSEMPVGVRSTNGQPRQSMRYEFELLGFDKTFYAYNSHYKAGVGQDNEQRRLVEAQAIREDARQLGDASIIYAGDFNFYSADEPSFQHLIAPGDAQALDPLSFDWSSPSVHTQSPLTMDDRFDFQLVSEDLLDGLGMDLVSYRTFGNNGTHPFEGSIIEGNGASPDVLEALTMASDHLPVVVDYTPALIGDSTLDDIFDSSDLVAVFQAGEYEDDVDDNSNWKGGDWNSDHDFDSGDLVYALTYGSYETPVQPVPEPESMAMTCLAVAVCVSRRVRSMAFANLQFHSARDLA